MILTVQDRIRDVILGADFAANVAAVNAKFVADGVTIKQPTDKNIYDYENETVRTDSDRLCVYILPQNSDYDEYASDNVVSVPHTFFITFILLDQSPENLNRSKMMMAEAAGPAFIKGIRDGGNIYQSVVRRIDYLPQVANGPNVWITDVTLTVEVTEYISQESIDS